MQSAGMPTFQQTFGRCSFPEGVLSVLGGYPAQVLVHKAQRRMEVRLFGPQADAQALDSARKGLISAFQLSDAEIQVIQPPESRPPLSRSRRLPPRQSSLLQNPPRQTWKSRIWPAKKGKRKRSRTCLPRWRRYAAS